MRVSRPPEPTATAAARTPAPATPRYGRSSTDTDCGWSRRSPTRSAWNPGRRARSPRRASTSDPGPWRPDRRLRQPAGTGHGSPTGSGTSGTAGEHDLAGGSGVAVLAFPGDGDRRVVGQTDRRPQLDRARAAQVEGADGDQPAGPLH